MTIISSQCFQDAIEMSWHRLTRVLKSFGYHSSTCIIGSVSKNIPMASFTHTWRSSSKRFKLFKVKQSLSNIWGSMRKESNPVKMGMEKFLHICKSGKSWSSTWLLHHWTLIMFIDIANNYKFSKHILDISWIIKTGRISRINDTPYWTHCYAL